MADPSIGTASTPVPPPDTQWVLRLADDPEAAKEWLGHLAQVRSMPWTPALRAANPYSAGGAQTGPQAIADCLKKWHAKVMTARRQHRDDFKRRGSISTAPSVLEEQKNFDWLVKFTVDFVNTDFTNVHRPGLSAMETATICESVLQICHTTNLVDDLRSALLILNVLTSHQKLLASRLLPTMKVLCQLQAFLADELSDLIMQCLQSILDSNDRQEILETICLLAEPTLCEDEKDKQMSIRTARGSLALLRELLPEKVAGDAFALNFDRLSSIAARDAKFRIVKLSTEVLRLCGSLITEEYRFDDSFDKDWTKAIEAIALSLKPFSTSLSEEAPSTSLTTFEADQSKDGRNHQKAARELATSLAALLQVVSVSKGKMLYDCLLSYPEYMDDEARSRILQFADSESLCFPTNHSWRNEVKRLVRLLAGTLRWTPELRKRGGEVIGGFFQLEDVPTEEDSASEHQDLPEYQELIQILLQMLYEEEDAEVCRVLLKSLLSAQQSEYQTRTIISWLLVLLTPKLWQSTPMPSLLELRELQFVPSPALSEAAAEGLIATFCTTSVRMPQMGKLLYQSLILAVMTKECPPRARISIMHLLFSLRCDASGRIYLLHSSESEYIAAIICRTEATAEILAVEEPPTNRATTGATLSTKPASPNETTWMYPNLENLAPFPEVNVMRLVARGHQSQEAEEVLDTSEWLFHLIQSLQNETNWEIYSFIIVHLSAQLANVEFFIGSLPTIVKLRQILSERIRQGTILDPPDVNGLRRSDVAICLFNVLTSLIPYGTVKDPEIEKAFGDDLVRTFLSGIGEKFDGTAKSCIHALTVCAFELPASVADQYPAIIDKMSRSMTQPYLTMDILDLLSQIARLPQLHSNFREDEIRVIFGICIQVLERVRAQSDAVPTASSPPPATPQRYSHVSARRPPYRRAMVQNTGLPVHVAALAYHTMIYWFLSLLLDVRAKYVRWITPRLIVKNPERGEEFVTEQSRVFINMMQRAAFSDLGETIPDPHFTQQDNGEVRSDSWVHGSNVITIETAGHTGQTQVIIRQASGTTFSSHKQNTSSLPKHHVPIYTDIRPAQEESLATRILPPHVFLQMYGIVDCGGDDEAIPLPKEDFVDRALKTFDRIPTVDNHKFGILFIGPDQSSEDEYLANTSGSEDYAAFLNRIGYSVSLRKPVEFNSQGLEYPRDGETTIAWRDRVVELVYLVPTLMPTNKEDDPHSSTKKMHVGNCHVNIVFNLSGQEWQFSNFRSQLNYVNVVVSPATRPVAPQSHLDSQHSAFYKVQLLVRTDLQSMSAIGEPKVVTEAALAPFVRMVGLNADVFCSAYNASKEGDAEFPSSWRARLQEIERLRGRVQQWRKEKVTGGKAVEDEGSLAKKLDFSRVTL